MYDAVAWLMNGQVSKLVLIIQGLDSKVTLERWEFNVQADDSIANSKAGKA